MSAAGVGYLAAFAGGVVSFASPCVLPLVPAYLSIVTGLEISEIQQGPRHHLWRIARDTGLFIAGFAMVFIMLGLTATTLGQALVHRQALITRISGLLVLAFALFIAGSLVLKSPLLYQERRFHPRLSRYGPLAVPVAGMAFGFGWTPCIGPVLGSVLAVAATQGRAVQGATLLAAYSLGLGVPFLAAGLFFGRMAGAFRWVKRHYTAITITSACALGFFGVLLALNRLIWVTSQLQAAMRHIGLHGLVFLG
jgi:cytochrome c-type biogenesis protein